MQIALGEILKLFLWGIVVFLAQAGLTPLLEINGIRPDLLLIFVMTVVFHRGK